MYVNSQCQSTKNSIDMCKDPNLLRILWSSRCMCTVVFSVYTHNTHTIILDNEPCDVSACVV